VLNSLLKRWPILAVAKAIVSALGKKQCLICVSVDIATTTVTLALAPMPAKAKAKVRAPAPANKAAAKGSAPTPAKAAAMVSAPTPTQAVAKADAGLPSEPFHPPSIVVKIVGIEMDDQGNLCREHINCSMVLDDDMVVHLWKAQLIIEG
jgi:hypothetical protein